MPRFHMRPASRLASAAALLTALAASSLAAGCGSNARSRLADAVPAQPTPSKAVPAAAKRASPSQVRAALDKLPALPAASAASPAANVVGSGKETVTQFIAQISGDVSNVWAGMFAETGTAFTPATLVEVGPGQHAASACGHTVISFDPVGPFYCPPDQSIYIPVALMDKIIYKKYGDFAVAYAVAHEWGHRIQDLLGILAQKAQGKLLTIQTETQADCLAGLWARTAFKRGLLEKGDIQEAVNVGNLVGDADGTPETAPGAHGLAGLRTAWFLTGYRSGKFSDCKTYR